MSFGQSSATSYLLYNIDILTQGGQVKCSITDKFQRLVLSEHEDSTVEIGKNDSNSV